MAPVEWVELLASPGRRIDAMRALVGGVTASELRRADPSEDAFAALVAGTRHENPRVRWWSVQLLDHVPDPRSIAAFVERLHDPVPRVRRNAAHALGCATCKPGWDRELDEAATTALRAAAVGDPNTKVRTEARHALACRS